MSTLAVVGLQWGDEGKGKIVDLMSRENDVIVRCQGGSNAGHTVVVDGEKYALHLVPSGILTPDKINVIASGVVIDPVELVKEIEALRGRGVEVGKNLLISDRAHVVFGYHRQLDVAQETKRASGTKIGTTGRGIGPAYSDKYSRSGFRMGDIMNTGFLRATLAEKIAEKDFLLREYFKTDGIDLEKTLQDIGAAADTLRPYVTDTSAALRKYMAQGKKILFEGAQGALLDIDYGTYPFVTSSNTTTAGIPTGTGLPPTVLKDILGVLKAYTTRVGTGPFPTELDNEIGERLRKMGGEFGATTGRPRRCGWFDAVASRHGAELNGCTEIALTKLDVLDGFDRIKVCVAYELDGKRLTAMPPSAADVERVQPVYEEVAGWGSITADTRRFDELPKAAQEYVAYLEKLVGCRITMVSVGQERMAIIMREGD